LVSEDLLPVLIFPDSQKDWLAETIVPSPLSKFYLADNRWLNPTGAFSFRPAVERFKGILHMAAKTSLKTNSAMPEWTAAKVIEAWNVPGFQRLENSADTGSSYRLAVAIASASGATLPEPAAEDGSRELFDFESV
jgi:hypothetical protein